MPPRSPRLVVAVLLLLSAGLFLALPLSGGAEPGKLQLIADQLGPGGTVILLNNCDASDMPADGKDHSDKYDPDNTDCLVNGPADWKQLEPIRIGRSQPKGPVTLKLANYHPDDPEPAIEKVRIFNAKGNAILGKLSHSNCSDKLSDSYTLSDDERKQLAAGDLTVYAEGLQFAVTARLQLFDDRTVAHELVLHVAPFLLAAHTQTPVHSMVVKLPDNPDSTRYVADFAATCQKAGVKHLVLDSIDPWIEDELQWGYTQTPRCRMPVALHMHRQRELSRHIRGLLAPNVGYFKAYNYASAANNSLDYGGDLEVTPPVKDYPFGRVYFGSQASDRARDPHFSPRHMSREFQAFFKRQKAHPSDPNALQEPINLCVDWLFTGHVDDVVCFIPANNARGFVLLYASPDLARGLLEGLTDEQRRDPAYLDGDNFKKTDANRYKLEYGCVSAQNLLDLDGSTIKNGYGFLNGSLHSYNAKVQALIDRNVDILKKELGLADADVRPVPVLFCNAVADYADPTRVTTWQAVALTPGVVNLTSLGQTCLVPDPLIPVFRDNVSQTLKGIGQQPVYIDDWFYHTNSGEVHTGSNTQRQPPERKWWSVK
jgi:protein-arginine deiminase